MEPGDMREILLRGGITTEEKVIVRGQASPALESVERATITPEGSGRVRTQELTCCLGCLRVFHEPKDIAAVCITCGRLLCASCASTVCSNPNCQKSICPEDRRHWSDEVLCRYCSRWLRIVLRALVIAACLAGLCWLAVTWLGA